MSMKHLRNYFLTVSAAFLGLVALPTAHAVNSWVGAAGDGNWNSGANWDTGAVPALAQVLTFSGNMQTITSNNIGSFTAASFLFTNDGTSGKTSSFTLGGPNGVTSSASFSINTTAVTGTAITDTISLNLTLNNNASINTGASHNLIASGAILNGTGQRTFSKTGLGELTLTSAGNTYGGATSINQGILTVDVAGGIANQGVASALGRQTTAANAQLNFNGGTLNVKSGANSTDRQIRIGSDAPTAIGGATIANNSANGSTPLVFTTAAFNNTTDTGMNAVTAGRTLTLGGANTDANSINGVIADHNTGGGGIVRVTKADTGRWILSGANTYTGATTIDEGTLAVNGSLYNSGSVVVNANGLLGGSGSVGAISGSGTVGPGNSPGILTATSVNPTAGTDFKFEFTSLSPTYTTATASGNDLLRLTASSSPFAGGAFTSGNIVSIYLNSSAITDNLLAGTNTTFSGGFFVDGTYALASALTSASFAYYTTSSALGTGSAVDYNGTSYYALANTAAQITLSNTLVSDAAFAAGTASGTLLTFNAIAIPEPSTGTLLGFGLGGLVLTRLMRRKQS